MLRNDALVANGAIVFAALAAWALVHAALGVPSSLAAILPDGGKWGSNAEISPPDFAEAVALHPRRGLVWYIKHGER